MVTDTQYVTGIFKDVGIQGNHGTAPCWLSCRGIAATAKVSSIKSFKAWNLLGQRRGTACQDLLRRKGFNSSLRMPPTSHALVEKTPRLLRPRQVGVGSSSRPGASAGPQPCPAAARGCRPPCLTMGSPGDAWGRSWGTQRV